MRCEEFKEKMLEAMAGGEGVPGEHTRECPGCAAELAEFQKTFALLDEWTAPEPSAYFDTRLQARLREEAARPAGVRARWFRWARVPVLAGAMGALLVGGFSLYRNQIASPAPTHECAVSDLQNFDKNYDLLKDLDTLDDNASQPSDLPSDSEEL